MPNKKLPEQITENLPKKAQDIWKKTYESAKKFYKKNPDKIRGNQDPEEVAARTAWDQVKESGYKKNKKDGEWEK